MFFIYTLLNERRISMERLYEQVKNDFDATLKSNFEDIVNQNHFPYTSENFSKDCYVTFLASNQDIGLTKKNISKHKQNHPTLKLSYSLDRYPNFHEVKSVLWSKERRLESIPNYPILLFPGELEPQWRRIIVPRVHNWINTIFAKTMLMYKEKYSITLAFLILEMYIETPEKMYITKFPSFEDLVFVTSERHPKILENDKIITQQVEIIKSSPFFKGKI